MLIRLVRSTTDAFGPVAAPRRGRRGRAPAAEGTSTAEDAYRAFAPSVLGYLRGIGVAEPEDLLGDVFVQVARSIGTFRGDADQLRRWVFTVTRNCVVDDRRRRARRPVVERAAIPDGPVSSREAPDPSLVEALAALTPEQREVVGLRFIADLPLDEVSALTGRPTGAVKSMQHRALAQLARHLDPEEQR